MPSILEESFLIKDSQARKEWLNELLQNHSKQTAEAAQGADAFALKMKQLQRRQRADEWMLEAMRLSHSRPEDVPAHLRAYGVNRLTLAEHLERNPELREKQEAHWRKYKEDLDGLLFNFPRLGVIQRGMDALLQHADEPICFNVPGFINELAEDLKRPKLFPEQNIYTPSKDAIISQLSDIGVREPLVHVKLLILLTFASSIAFAPHRQGCECFLCTHIAVSLPAKGASQKSKTASAPQCTCSTSRGSQMPGSSK